MHQVLIQSFILEQLLEPYIYKYFFLLKLKGIKKDLQIEIYKWILITATSMGCIFTSQSNQIVPAINVKRPPIINTSKQKVKRLNASFSDDRQIQNVMKQQYTFTEEDIQMLEKTICDHFLLYRIQATQRNKVINSMSLYTCQKETTVFKKHDQASLFFIIKSGQVQVINETLLQHGHIKFLKRGDYFGDLALLYSAPRSATVKTITDCQFFCISHQIFRKIVKEIIKKNYDISKNFLDKAPVFSYLSQREKNTLAFNTIMVKFAIGQTIFKEKDDANCLYIVASGKVDIQIAGKPNLQIKQGDSFGESSFKQNQIRVGTALAKQQTTLLSISRDTLKQCLGNNLKQIYFFNVMRWAFSRNEFLKQLSTAEREKLLKQAQIKEYRNKQIICTEGTKAQFIAITLEEKINKEEIGSIFNIEYLVGETQNDLKITNNLVKEGKGCVATIKLDKIKKIMGKNSMVLLKQISGLTVSKKRQQYLSKIELDELVILKKIGQGQFSKIFCVMDKFKRLYALKLLYKQIIVQKKVEQIFINEKQIMMKIDSPFLVKLLKIFKDDYFIYMMTNYIEGVDLFDLIKQVGAFNKIKTRNFFGCLILAVQHLHKQNIIHRDLKPENIIVDDEGYLSICDFSVSKVLSDQSGLRTFTIIGTPHYMAPQIIDVKGYSFPIDFWSLGVILYEMVCGALPFAGHSQDPYQILRLIDSKQLQFPQNCQDFAVKELIQKLLCKNPHKRYDGQFENIKRMEFFKDMEWQNLQKRELKNFMKIRQNSSKDYLNEKFNRMIKKQKGNVGKVSLSLLDTQF